jgi:hypothetical protein
LDNRLNPSSKARTAAVKVAYIINSFGFRFRSEILRSRDPHAAQSQSTSNVAHSLVEIFATKFEP